MALGLGSYEADTGRRLEVERRHRGFQTGVITVAAAGTATLLAAPATGLKNKLLSLIIANTNAAAGKVDFKDGASGTVILTVFVTNGDTKAINFGGLFTQPTAATLLQMAATTGNYSVVAEYLVEA